MAMIDAAVYRFIPSIFDELVKDCQTDDEHVGRIFEEI